MKELVKKNLFLLSMILILSIIICSCTPENKPGPGGATPAPKPVELAVHVGSEPDTIDPALNSAADVATMLIHAFEGLMSLDENGTPI